MMKIMIIIITITIIIERTALIVIRIIVIKNILIT